jgi:imidazoleglycerol phosphate synthase glutamine amidotransferase subunit HisH
MASTSFVSLLVLVAMASAASAQLLSTFYDTSCPDALSTIRRVVTAAVRSEPRMGASLVRLHFHDSFVDVSNSHLAYSVHSYTVTHSHCKRTACVRAMHD